MNKGDELDKMKILKEALIKEVNKARKYERMKQ
jgi:hypothetical protein